MNCLPISRAAIVCWFVCSYSEVQVRIHLCEILSLDVWVLNTFEFLLELLYDCFVVNFVCEICPINRLDSRSNTSNLVAHASQLRIQLLHTSNKGRGGGRGHKLAPTSRETIKQIT